MLTRDFTCSRNRSQEFVAVVIAKRKTHPVISTDVNKLGKAGPFILFSGFGNHARTGSSCFPLAPRARPFKICRPLVPQLSDSAGLSPIGRNGAREKCAKGCTGVHTPCTVFPQAHFLCNSTGKAAFKRKLRIIFPPSRTFAQGQSKSS